VRLPRLKSKLGREIALLLAAKIALLVAIRAAFFSDPVLPKMTEGMDPGRVAAAIVAPAPNP
jgi:hypothetical protein